jgi:hypothetical protein
MAAVGSLKGGGWPAPKGGGPLHSNCETLPELRRGDIQLTTYRRGFDDFVAPSFDERVIKGAVAKIVCDTPTNFFPPVFSPGIFF